MYRRPEFIEPSRSTPATELDAVRKVLENTPVSLPVSLRVSVSSSDVRALMSVTLTVRGAGIDVSIAISYLRRYLAAHIEWVRVQDKRASLEAPTADGVFALRLVPSACGVASRSIVTCDTAASTLYSFATLVTLLVKW